MRSLRPKDASVLRHVESPTFLLQKVDDFLTSFHIGQVKRNKGACMHFKAQLEMLLTHHRVQG